MRPVHVLKTEKKCNIELMNDVKNMHPSGISESPIAFQMVIPC
jgi:hypothetical protein